MASTIKRETSLTLDAEVLDGAKALDINVLAVAEAALRSAVASARQAQWFRQNAEAFAAQAAWHERHGHPLADILSAPVGLRGAPDPIRCGRIQRREDGGGRERSAPTRPSCGGDSSFGGWPSGERLESGTVTRWQVLGACHPPDCRCSSIELTPR